MSRAVPDFCVAPSRLRSAEKGKWYVTLLTQPPVKAKGGKMMSLIDYRLRVTLNDGRQLTGQLLAFDTHMNIVLSDSTLCPLD